MAFDYGKNTIAIKNPFKIEGLMDIIFGGGTLTLGIILIFQIRKSIDAGFEWVAWFEMFLAIAFLGVGIRTLTAGGIRLFRFLVGRDIPADISPDPYNKDMIEKFLMNRSNPTFVERNNFISRLLISIFDKFLFLPVGFRNLLESVSSMFFSLMLFFLIYLLTVFSTTIGLISLTDKKVVLTLFTLFFLLKQLIVWFNYRPILRRRRKIMPKAYSYTNITINIIVAILVPTLLELAIRNGIPIPDIQINIILPTILLMTLAIILVGVTFFLSVKRLEVLNPETMVSEYKEHIQVSIHPKDIFRCFEMEMANKRYKELPNRIYKEVRPVLELEGSKNKGSFHGSTIQETQPVYKDNNLPDQAQKVRLVAAVTGRIFLLFSFLFLFYSSGYLKVNITAGNIFNILYYPILAILFGSSLINVAHLFFSEIQFTSYLVHFFSDGTYTESKVSSGMSVYDSNRSENTIVNSSATPWILVSKVVTSTIADSSTKNLEGRRFILEMYKADDFLNDLVVGFNNYLNNRKLIVGFNSEADIENSMGFHKLNEITRANNVMPKVGIENHTRREELDEDDTGPAS